MSYAVFTSEDRFGRSFHLVGQGDHEGTTLTLTDRDILKMPSARADLASAVDRLFLKAHDDRLHRAAMRPVIEPIAAFARAFA